jgi:hypothetical protein
MPTIFDRLKNQSLDTPQVEANNDQPNGEDRFLNYFQSLAQKQQSPNIQKEVLPVEREPTNLEEFGRHLSRSSARGLEALLGIPGNYLSLAQDLAIKAPESVLGQESPSWRKAVKSISLPTTQDLREFGKKATLGALEPKTPGEERADEIVSDIFLLADPKKGVPNLLMKIGDAFVGSGIKYGLDSLGVSKGKQELIKNGYYVIRSFMDRGGAKKHIDDLYKQRDASIPVGAKVDAKDFTKNLRSLKSSLEKGVQTSEKTAVIKPINELIKKSKDGKIDIREVIQAKADINSLIKDPSLQKGVEKLFNPVSYNLNKLLTKYGKEQNPSFLKLQRESDNAFGAYEQSRKAVRFIQKHLSKDLGKQGGAGALIATLIHPKSIMVTGPLAGASLAGLKAYEYYQMISKSPVLRKYFSGILIEAAKENAPAMINNYKKLEKELEKEELDQ